MIRNFLKQLFCDHRYMWLRNIYGDEIQHSGGKRSVWQCSKCSKLEYRQHPLNATEYSKAIHNIR